MVRSFSRVLANIYGRQLDREQWPILLGLSLTNRCNLRCYMCKTHSRDMGGSLPKYQDMPEELFLKIEPLINKVDYINLAGIGEPTISNYFLQRVRRIRQLNHKAYLKINTNGTSLSSLDFAKKMIPLFDCIHLSLNGVKSYTEITGGYPLKNIKQSLENIKLVRKRLKKPCRLIIGFVLMQRNLRDIVDAAVLAKEMRADQVSYQDLRVFNYAMRRESARHHPDLASLILNEVRKAARVGIPVRCELTPSSPDNDSKPPFLKTKNESRDSDKMPLFYDQPCQEKQFLDKDSRVFNDKLRVLRRKLDIDFQDYSVICHDPWESVLIHQDARVFLCCHASSIGNLKEKSFEKIWLGDEAMRYREGIITGHYYKDCTRCKVIFKNQPSAYEKL